MGKTGKETKGDDHNHGNVQFMENSVQELPGWTRGRSTPLRASAWRSLGLGHARSLGPSGSPVGGRTDRGRVTTGTLRTLRTLALCQSATQQ